MGKYIVRRLLWAVVVVLCVSAITFFITFVIPADPAKQIAGPHATPQVLATIRHQLGLDKPVYYQYGLYLWHLVHANLGYSYINQLPVTQSILQRFPATVMIAVFGILFELLIGIPIGMISALRQYRAEDRAATIFSLVFVSMPSFFLGMLLLYFFAFRVNVFPNMGAYPGAAHPLYFVLPGLTLGLTGAAWYSRMLRSKMLDILNAEYVKAARAKGLPERIVVWRHIMRNAWSPIITLLGMDIGWFLGGVVIVEIVFGVPGIGWQAWQAIQNLDHPVIMGTVEFAALLVVLANLVTDIAYTWLDPRVKYS
ncbi:MAG TPA: ABC transporter permease [Thermoleophilia bacterium]|nr:ABC transporter permease [Thermoleophilia bacterium]